MLDSKLGIMYAILPVASRLQIVKCVLYTHVKKCKTQNYDLSSQVDPISRQTSSFEISPGDVPNHLPVKI